MTVAIRIKVYVMDYIHMRYPVQFYVPVDGKTALIHRDRFVVGNVSVDINTRERDQLMHWCSRNDIGSAAALLGSLMTTQLITGCNSNGQLVFKRQRAVDPVEA
jgi:hypothetical protein